VSVAQTVLGAQDELVQPAWTAASIRMAVSFPLFQLNEFWRHGTSQGGGEPNARLVDEAKVPGI